MDIMVERMKALGDPNRFRIVMMLLHRPLCVCELLRVLDIAGGTLSNHLRLLKHAGLISQKRDGKWIIYSIDEEARGLITLIAQRIMDDSCFQADRSSIDATDREGCQLITHEGPTSADNRLDPLYEG